MSQAPPTPPPTGAAELMQVAGDAGAVDTTSVAAPTTTAPAAPPNTNTDPYRQSLSLITDLVASTNYDEVIRVAELGDLNYVGDNSTSRFSIVAPLLLAYLIQDELPPARFVLMRLPSTLASQPIPQALFALYTSVVHHNYQNVYKNSERLLQVVTAEGADPQLGTVLSAMVHTFVDRFRKRTLSLITHAYTSINVIVAQNYFNFDTESTSSAMSTAGWTLDTSRNSYVAPPAQKATSKSGIGSSSLNSLDFVTSATAKLEA